VKHLTTVTKTTPSAADAVQDVVCIVANAIAGIIEAKGGTAPIVGWIDEKCDLPEPNP